MRNTRIRRTARQRAPFIAAIKHALESLEERRMLAGDPYISEFLADNASVIADGNGTFSDYIEIHNPGAAAIDLSGWHLTDDDGLPGKWTFPSFSIPAGQYRIVFASSKVAQPYTDSLGYPHTNFSLNAGGEYLALTRPDNSVASEFAPEFPEQTTPNVSYGIGAGGGTTATLLASNSPGKANVPTASIGTGWKDAGFNDSGWTNVTTGVGFEANTTSVPALPNEIESNSSPGQANNATANFAALSSNLYQHGFSGEIATTSDVDFYRIGQLQAGDIITITMTGTAGSGGTLGDPHLQLRRGGTAGTLVLTDTDGGSGSDSLIHKFVVTDTDTYFIRAASSASTTGTYRVGIMLENSGSAPGTSGDFTAESESNNTGGTADDASSGWRAVGYRSRTAGQLSTDYFRFQFYAGDRVTVHVDQFGGTNGVAEIYAANGTTLLAREDGSSTLPTVDQNDASLYSFVVPATDTYYVKAFYTGNPNGNYNLDVYLSTLNTPPRAAQMTGQFVSSVQGDMYNKNATAYVRVPFNVASVANIGTLTLRMKYEDGFVAYINGQKVAERSAPASPVWNSAATGDRTIAQATVFEDINISAFISSLVNGQNVLAIQGLNSSAASEEFLIVPEITAQVNTTGTPQFMYQATPGQPNITGAGVVINEVHYNPDVETQLVEFIELHNSAAVPIDISGWKLVNGVTYTVAAGTTLAAGAYYVITQDAAQFQSKYGFAANGVFTGSLTNEGERVRLIDAALNTVDDVTYGAGFPWPTVGDPLTTPGTGGSIQLINPGMDNDIGGHWRSAAPTPNARNTAIFAANAAPAMRQVEHSPTNPTSNQPVTITAKVTDPDGVSSVSVQYQVNDPGAYIPYRLVSPTFGISVNPAYETGWVTLAMYDDGTHGDATPGDGVFSAQIPPEENQHRTLIRYRITATDALGASIRGPYADDPSKNFAYYVYNGVPDWTGSVNTGGPTTTFGPEVMNSLPVYQFITTKQDHANALYVPVGTVTPQGGSYGGDEYLWAGTLVYDGKVYDNVRWRARGGVWRYAMGKNMWKIDFNRNQEFEWRDPWGNEYPTKMKKLNLGAVIQQGNFGQRGEQGLFEYAGFKLFNLAGSPAPNTAPVHLRIVEDASENGPTSSQYDDDFQGLYLAIEQEDGQFLKQHNLPDGNLYKMEGGTGELNNQGPTQPSNKADLNTFQSGMSGATEQWWRDNVNIDAYFGYRAMVEAIHHWDIGFGKNYFYYHNPDTDKWEEMSWDLDLTWTTTYEPGNGDAEPLKAMLNHPGLMRDYQAKLREIIDLLWNPEQTGQLLDEYASLVWKPTGNTFVEADRRFWDNNPIMFSSYVNSGKANVRYYTGASPQTFAGFVQKLKNYIVTRTNTTTSIPSLGSRAADALIPNKPTVTYNGPAGFATDQLSFTSSAFSSGNSTFGAMKWRIAEVYDASNPAYANWQGEKPYEIRANWESAELTSFNGTLSSIPANSLIPGRSYRVRVKMKDANGRWSNWSNAVQFIAGPPDSSIGALRITELMYNPADPPAGSTYTADDFEYLEFMNTGTGNLDLSGVHFTNGIEFTFPQNYVLAAGARALLVSDLAAFQSRYGNGLNGIIAGEYLGQLSDGGEDIEVVGPAGQVIHDFDYSDNWQPQTDGEGFSLAIINPTGDPVTWDDGAFWKAVQPLGGTPGAIDTGLAPNSIVVNEILSNPATAGTGWIELRNTTNATIDISGWFLSDDGDNLLKYQFPAGTTIAAGARLVLDEATSYGLGANAFTLSSIGGTIYLSQTDGGTNLLGYREVQGYDAADAGVTLGRHIKSTGRQDFVAMASATQGAENGAPRVGPIVINEVMYNPAAGGNEYIEIRNITGQAVDVSGWRFDGLSFTFPLGSIIDPHGYAMIVPIDPAAFRTQNGVPAQVQIFGPYAGLIDDAGENIELEKLVGSGVYVSVDRVSFESGFPWPTTPNGTGPSLARQNKSQYGNDVVNWAASASGGSPGKPNKLTTVSGVFDYLETAVRVRFTFSEDVFASLQLGDVTIANLSGGGVPATSLSWDPATLTASWTFNTIPADGNYRATLNGALVSDFGGALVDGNNDSSPGGNATLDFFYLSGDFNGDRAVDGLDFNALFANFGLATGGYSNGDINRDGVVNFTDFQLFERAMGGQLAAPAAVPAGASTTSTPKKKVTAAKQVIAAAPVAKPAPVKRAVFSVKRVK